jgi:hypothetical protein
MNQINFAIQRQRPLSLQALCMLGFVFGAIAIIINSILILAGSFENTFKQFVFLQRIMGSFANHNGFVFAVIGLVLSVIAFLGIIQMWNQLRTGFWLFVIPKMILLIIPFFLLDIPANHLVYIMLPYFIMIMFFIVLFSFNYKSLH